MEILVTGGAGFIGSNLVRYLLASKPYVRVVNLDALTYAGTLDNLRGLGARHAFVRGDIGDAALVRRLMAGTWKRRGWQARPIEAVVHLAAESHVDRSLRDAAPFLRTNVLGTQVLLEATRHAPRVKKFLHVSTDEVYGTLGARGKFTETSPLEPRSPYAASKAAGDMLARAYHHAHGLPVVVVRPSNTYGPRQFPEKFIPLMLTRLMEGKEIPIYGEGLNVREWLHVDDLCRGLWAALEKGRAGEAYNLGGGNERRNIAVARAVLRLMRKPASLLRFVADRPGHDFRYALDPVKAARELGWKPRVSFEAGLRRTVAWYRENADWVARRTSGDYRRYYRAMYGARGMKV